MASALDVAQYILERRGSMTTLKLQKLVYYSAAYHAAWDRVALFDEPILAWTHGPVVYELFKRHQGRYSVQPDENLFGESANLDENEVETIDAVLDALGGLSGKDLEARTHREDPWLDAFDEADDYHRTPISVEAMREYYGRD